MKTKSLIMFATMPFSILATLGQANPEERRKAIPAGRLTSFGQDSDGNAVVSWINPDVAIDADGTPVEIQFDRYVPSFNHVLLLDGNAKLLIEDAANPIDAAAKLADAALPLIVDDETINGTDYPVAQMATPSDVTDRVRVITSSGQHLVLDLSSYGPRLTASLVSDETTGIEYVVIAAEGKKQVYAAQSSNLAQAKSPEDAVASFEQIGEMDNEIARFAKPEDAKVEVSYKDATPAQFGIDDGALKVYPAKTRPAMDADTDTAGSPWEAIGSSRAITDADGQATYAAVKPSQGSVAYRFAPAQQPAIEVPPAK